MEPLLHPSLPMYKSYYLGTKTPILVEPKVVVIGCRCFSSGSLGLIVRSAIVFSPLDLHSHESWLWEKSISLYTGYWLRSYSYILEGISLLWKLLPSSWHHKGVFKSPFCYTCVLVTSRWQRTREDQWIPRAQAFSIVHLLWPSNFLAINSSCKIPCQWYPQMVVLVEELQAGKERS